jgi:hypothetical protein
MSLWSSACNIVLNSQATIVIFRAMLGAVRGATRAAILGRKGQTGSPAWMIAAQCPAQDVMRRSRLRIGTGVGTPVPIGYGLGFFG